MVVHFGRKLGLKLGGDRPSKSIPVFVSTYENLYFYDILASIRTYVMMTLNDLANIGYNKTNSYSGKKKKKKMAIL